MSRGLVFTLVLSLAGLVVGVAIADIWLRRPRRLWPTGAMLLLAGGIYCFGLPYDIESKGPVEEGIAVVFCYLAMLLGMAAEYGFAQAERGRRRLKWEPLAFFMPIFASPIVFIPLLTIIADMSIGGAFTKTKLMVYLVAFQNGFFWKGFFEQRRNAAQEAGHERPALPDRAA